jgi:outer membrane PBP1 activator LpoA protein
MWREMAKGLVLAAVLSGLCPSTQANTTAALIAQAGLATPAAEPVPAKVRMALLLPLRSETLGPAADALRAGFMAAYAHEMGGVAVNLVETDDTTQGLLTGYADAAAHNDIVIGPLSRSGVTLIARGDVVRKPTIALSQPDVGGDVELVLPPQMLIISLSIEDEARQIATVAWADQKMPKALVVSTNVAWQRRAAKAFAAQWQRLGQEPQSIELGVIGGYLSGNSLDQLRKRIQIDKPGQVFVALDAAQARQLRSAIGNDIALYGTSQLNPLTRPDWVGAEPIPELNGAQLLDIPWQLQPDHPAVMIYPHPVPNAERKYSADLERLYALGIDAYRIAREIAARHSNFDIDGVTGKLTVSFGAGPARFERIEQQAIYQDGTVVPLMSADRRQ